MLSESRMHSFIDKNKEFSIHFFEGQKLIQDLAVIHNVKNQGFAYFRDSALTAQLLMNFLKPGEFLGLFIDCDEPYFRLKFEISEIGAIRCLLMPQNFNQFPEKLNGNCRLTKMSKNSRVPYTSVIKLENTNFHQVVNQVLKESYQVKAEVIVSEDADQSALFMKLPYQKIDDVEDKSETLENFLKINKEKVNDIFKEALNNIDDVKDRFSKLGFVYLKSTEVKFRCSCSRERMILGLASLVSSTSIDEIFEGKSTLETKCDYCHTYYEIQKEELIK